MVDIVTRSGKGSPLTNAEVDANFTNLAAVSGVTSVANKTGAVVLDSSDVGLGNVENKSSATIRSEITSTNVTTALGFTPYNATNPTGYITSSALSGYLTSAAAASTYLPLAGGNLSGTLSFQQPVGLGFANGQYIKDNSSGGLVIYSANAVNINGTSITINGNTTLHAGNYNSYSPTLTGIGASGTWGISISGNAATATSATDSTKLPLAGGTLTGNLLFSNSGTTKRGIQGTVGDNDFWFIGGGATASNTGFMEIATGDDGQGAGAAEPIYVSQYGPGDVLTGTLVRRGSLLDASGNTSFPGTISASSFAGSLATGSGAYGTWGISVTGTSASISGYNNPTTAATGNTIAYRDSVGDISVRELVLNSALQSAVPTVLVGMFPTTNQLVRMTPAAVASAIQTGATGTWGINAATATRLLPINVTSSGVSYWNPQGLTYQAWGQSFAHSDISGDSGDLTMWLRPSQYSAGGTELCMIIDGDYFAGTGANKVLHAGNYNSYAPTLTGSGASGTWGISITGTAAGNLPLSGGFTATGSGFIPFNFQNTGSAVSNSATLLVQNNFGNHSWGITGEFRITGASDRPSILFSSDQSSTTWSVGFGSGTDNNFRINQDHGHRGSSGWGITRFLIDTAGTAYFSGNLSATGTFNNNSIWINDGSNTGAWNENIRLFDTSQGVSTIAFGATGTSGQPRNSFVSYSSYLAVFAGGTIAESIYNNYLVASGSYRAPIFYDSDDTGYFVDPSSTTNINGLVVNGTELVGTTTRFNSEILGVMRTTDGTVSTVPAVLRLSNNGTGRIPKLLMTDNAIIDGIMCMVPVNTTNSYFSFGFAGATEQGFLVYADGRTQSAASSRAPIFYDSDDTSYRCDPNSFSQLAYANLNATPSGRTLSLGGDQLDRVVDDSARSSLVINAAYYPHLYINATADNGNTVHGPVFSMTGTLSGGGGYRRWGMGIAAVNPDCFSWGYYDNNSNPHYSVGGTFGYTGTGSKMWLNTGGSLMTTGDMRAPIFYDSNDTGYYTDPASTSNLKRATVAGYAVGCAETIDLTGLDQSTYYPVGISLSASQTTRIKINVGLNSSSSPSWSTHPSGFTLVMDWENNGGGWGTTGQQRRINSFTYGWANVIPCGGIDQNNQASLEIVYLLGGGRYFIQVSGLDTSINLYQNGYDYGGTAHYARTTILNDVWSSASGNGIAVARVLTPTLNASSNVYSPVYYDNNDTGYYTDPNGTSYLQNLNVNYINFRSHMDVIGIVYSYRSDGGVILQSFNQSAGNLAQFNIRHSFGDVILENARGITYVEGSYVQTSSSFRAPVFYDSNNTAYYTDPNGRSTLNQATFENGLAFSSQFVLSSSGASLDNATGARLTESYGPYWNLSNSATWHHQIINGSSLVGISAGGGNFGGGNIYASGSITAYYSDERLKTKVGAIENALDKVKSLEGFIYVENDLARSLGYTNSGEQSGVSAQQVKAVLPQAVSLAPVDMQGVPETGDIVSKSGENYLTVDYSRLVPLLIEAIKEQDQEVVDLRNRVAQLESLINKLIGD